MQTETNYKVEIMHDTSPLNPRTEQENLGTMICFHKRYRLGDAHNYKSVDYNSWEEMEKDIIKNENPAVILPMYMFDHSGTTISTRPFSCPFDSGRIGFIYISADKVRKEYNVKNISKKLKERITNYLIGEVEMYDNYISGECYGYRIRKDGEILEDCWGYYGYSEAEKAAKDTVMYYINQDNLVTS